MRLTQRHLLVLTIYVFIFQRGEEILSQVKKPGMFKGRRTELGKKYVSLLLSLPFLSLCHLLE